MDTTRRVPSEMPPTAGFEPDAMRRIEAWLSLPERDRAELLGGRIAYKAMVTIERGDVVMGIAEQLGGFRGPPSPAGGGWWLSQEVDMFLAGQGLRPDVVGWRVDNNPRPPQKVSIGNKHLGVYIKSPDWVCEVLSTSTRSRDEEEGLKWRAYHEAGVGHYWLVDLTREQLTVYRRGERSYEPIEVAGRETVKALPPFESIQFQAKRVFLLSGILKSEAR